MKARLALGLSLLVGCGKLEGFGGGAPHLTTFAVTLDGELAPVRPTGITDVHALRVALVWGAQWLTEAFCVLPAESTDAQAVITAGCRDPFGFVPLDVAASVPLSPGTPATLTLDALPSADLLVGGVTARVVYGSVVVFDDRDDSGTLELSTPHRTAFGGDRGQPDAPQDSADLIYGASFVTMTKPDRRVAYREGAFSRTSAYYPRAGCPDPRPGFSIVGAGGFTTEAGKESALTGVLPPEDPATCFDAAPDATTVDVVAQAPAAVGEVGCDERTSDSSARYREPPQNAIDLTGRPWVCAHLPTFDTGAQPSSLIQLVVAGHDTDRCKGLTHYTLRGCRESVTCALPDWDFTTAPPAWWPCPH